MRNIFLFSGLMLSFICCQNKDSSTEEFSNVKTSPLLSTVKFSPPIVKKDEEVYEQSKPEEAVVSANYEVANDKPLSSNQITTQKLIRRAEVRMQVKDYEKSTVAIQRKLSAYNAYVTDGTEERAGEELENSLEIRVTNTQFDRLLHDLLGEGIYLERKNITVSDVSEEYIDKDARLKTKRKIEQRYLDLLAKAQNVKDILQIENQLSGIREEIEASEARLRYLDHQVAYSTIHISYFEKVIAQTAPENTFAGQLELSVKQGWASVINSFLAFISLWPILLISIPVLVWGIRKYKRRPIFEV